MITGLVRAGQILNRPDWIAAGEQAFTAVMNHLGSESTLGHAYRNGRVTTPGFAADHAAMALAALTLHEATAAPAYLAIAADLAATLWDRYRIEAGLLAATVATATDLPLRLAPTADDAMPNVHGLAAETFIRLSAMTGTSHWLERADDLIDAVSGEVAANAFAHASILNALDLRLRRAEITVAASADHPLSLAMQTIPYTNRTLLYTGEPSASPPHLLVCADGRCSLPLVDLPQAMAEIEKAVRRERPSQGSAV